MLILTSWTVSGVRLLKMEWVERCVDSFELMGVTNNKFEVLYAGVIGHYLVDITKPPPADQFLVIQIWTSLRKGKIVSEHAQIIEYRVLCVWTSGEV